MIKFSQTQKMQIFRETVASWSLQAGTSCPASKDAEVCKGCYAKKGSYHYPTVKAVRSHNRADYHRADWVSDMTSEINKRFTYFRWFDSGDVESVELANKIYEVIKNTPNTKHWLPTRTDKIPKINSVLLKISELPNVALRRSADNYGFKKERNGVNTYVIRKEDISYASSCGIFICPVTVNKDRKSCDDCTMCYTSQAVAYLLH